MQPRQRRFIEEYTVDFNATQAAIRAGYSKKTAPIYSYKLMQMPEVRKAIEQRMNELTMSADEATFRMTQMARANIADFITYNGGEKFYIDINKPSAKENLHLIKKLKRNETLSKDGDYITSTVEIELHDSMQALDKILKIWGKYAPERLQITDDSHDAYIKELNAKLSNNE